MHTKTIPTIPHHTIYSKEDLRPLVTISTTVMIVVHFTKVSTLYPRVVISSLAKRPEKHLFAILTVPLVCGLEITACRYKGLLLYARLS
jgi:hypothetical protein